MAYAKTTFKMFKDRLNGLDPLKHYDTAGGASKAIGKCDFTPAEKAEAQKLIAKKFGADSSAPAAKTAAKSTAAVKPAAAKSTPVAEKPVKRKYTRRSAAVTTSPNPAGSIATGVGSPAELIATGTATLTSAKMLDDVLISHAKAGIDCAELRDKLSGMLAAAMHSHTAANIILHGSVIPAVAEAEEAVETKQAKAGRKAKAVVVEPDEEEDETDETDEDDGEEGEGEEEDDEEEEDDL